MPAKVWVAAVAELTFRILVTASTSRTNAEETLWLKRHWLTKQKEMPSVAKDFVMKCFIFFKMMELKFVQRL